MSTIKYAVLVPSAIAQLPRRRRLAPEPYDQKGEHEVSHLYQHEADAERCTAVYVQQMGVPAFLVTITPPLAIIRRADAWGILDWSSRQLHVYASREEAALAVEPGRQLIATPIRQGMPTNHGTPQFGQVQS